VASGKPGIVPSEYCACPRFPSGRARGGSSRELVGSPGSPESLEPWWVPRLSNGRSGSGSVGPPRAPPWPSSRFRRVPSRDSRHVRRPRPKPWTATFMAFASPTERSGERWNRLSLVPPLVGFWALPPMYLPLVHSGGWLRGAGSFVPASPGAGHVPPSWFRTTSTVCSEWQLRVCCTPLPAKGSPRFVRAGEEVARRRPDAGDSSRGAVRTLRRVPLVSSRKRITATVAFLSLPSCPARGPVKPAVAPTAIPAGAGGEHRGASPGGGAPCPEGRGGRSRREMRLRAPKSGGLRSLEGRGRGRLRRADRPGPAGGGVAPRSGVALPCRGGGYQPCREKLAQLRGEGFAGPGGARRAGLRGVPAAGSRGGRRGSEELRSVPEEAGPTLRRTPGSRHHGGGPPRPGREVPGGSRWPGGAPKSAVGCRGGPGFTPEGWDGVRGRDSDAVMLRSACADPHITGHAAREEQAPGGRE